MYDMSSSLIPTHVSLVVGGASKAKKLSMEDMKGDMKG
jgi:hypothetical protein